MKYMLLLASTFMVVTSPVFGMDGDKELPKRTITIIANLDKKRSEPILQDEKNGERPGRFAWYGMPEDYEYNVKDHSISFQINFSPKPTSYIKSEYDFQEYEFETSYTPITKSNSEQETWYKHKFSAKLLNQTEDTTANATLLSIDRSSSVENDSRAYTTIYRMRTITIIADLDKTRTSRIEREFGKLEGHFHRDDMPKGYEYDENNHSIYFKIVLSSDPQQYNFKAGYTPVTKYKYEDERWNYYKFLAKIPAGIEDTTVNVKPASITH